MQTQEAPHSTERLLVIDDSLALGGVVKKTLASGTGLPVDLAASFADAAALLKEFPGAHKIAIVDLHLPDAMNGEAVDLMIENAITAVVLTGTLDPEMRERIMAKPVADYVLKQHPGAIDSVLRAVKRLRRNRGRKALLVHSVGSFRDYLQKILEGQTLQVEISTVTADIIERLRADEAICLLIIDHDPPSIDGVAMTASICAKFPQERVAVLGLSDSSDPFLGVQFLKAGASDLLRKPFVVEEFLSRANNCLDHLDSIQMVREQANRDYLTGLYNRRYFHEVGKTLFSSAKRGQVRLSAAMIDIDHFKSINDLYGHDTGDRVIVAVARALAGSFRGSDVVARLGGEEFCVLAVNSDQPNIAFERLRQKIESLEVLSDQGKPIPVTVSIGVSSELGSDVFELVNRADQLLYNAKQAGRNRVVMAD